MSANDLHAFDSPNLSPLATVMIMELICNNDCDANSDESGWHRHIRGLQKSVASWHSRKPYCPWHSLQADKNNFHSICNDWELGLFLGRIYVVLFRDVVLLRLFPSIKTETIRHFLAPPIQGVVLQCYGAGNMPSNRGPLLRRSYPHCHWRAQSLNKTLFYTYGVRQPSWQAGHHWGPGRGNRQGGHHRHLHPV